MEGEGGWGGQGRYASHEGRSGHSVCAWEGEGGEKGGRKRGRRKRRRETKGISLTGPVGHCLYRILMEF